MVKKVTAHRRPTHLGCNKRCSEIKRLAQYLLYWYRAARLVVEVANRFFIYRYASFIIVGLVFSNGTRVDTCGYSERFYDGTHFIHILYHRVCVYKRVGLQVKCV